MTLALETEIDGRSTGGVVAVSVQVVLDPDSAALAGARRLLAQAADGGRFASVLPVLSRFMRPACTLARDAGESGLADSRAGGLPGLPVGVDWPLVARADGFVEPMTFVGQINCGELGREWWPGPSDGLLSFFYAQGNHRGSEDAERARVLFVPAVGLSLVDRPRDDRPADSCHPFHPTVPFPSHRWQASWHYEIPGCLSAALEPLGMREPSSDDVDDWEEALEEYSELQWHFAELQGSVPTENVPGELGSAGLLGWPYVDHLDVLEENAGDGRWQDWALLLELGIGGTTLTFSLPTAALERGDFDSVVATSF